MRCAVFGCKALAEFRSGINLLCKEHKEKLDHVYDRVRDWAPKYMIDFEDWFHELDRTGNLIFDPDGEPCDRRQYTPEQLARLFPGQ